MMDVTHNAALMTVGRLFRLDGDLMRCRCCRRALIASREDERLHHADGCRNAQHVHPWEMLRGALADPVITPIADGKPQEATE